MMSLTQPIAACGHAAGIAVAKANEAKNLL
jgi:hypothetical protein